MAEKIICSMVGLNKIYPGNKQVLKDVYLSYFYGAKIGILGLNGAGKSTLMKIIAGDDTHFSGELHMAPNTKTGYLKQDPQLDESKTVKQNAFSLYHAP